MPAYLTPASRADRHQLAAHYAKRPSGRTCLRACIEDGVKMAMKACDTSHRSVMVATISRYYDKAAVEAEVRAGKHRESVGGTLGRSRPAPARLPRVARAEAPPQASRHRLRKSARAA